MVEQIHRIPKIAWVLALTLIVRATVLLSWFVFDGELQTFHTPDSETYLAPAQSLLDHGSLERDHAPEIVRGPGYPLLLSVGLAAGHVEAVTIALQLAISLTTVYLIYLCALAIDDRKEIALVAAALYAVEPLSVMYCCFLLTETLYTALIVAMLLCLLRFVHERRAALVASAATLLVASAFVRPVSYYLPIVVGGVLFLTVVERRSLLRPALLASGFCLACAIPLAAWQWRNWQLAEYPGFSAIVESNLYFYQEAQLISVLEGRPLKEVQSDLGMLDPQRLVEREPAWKGASPGLLHSLMGRQAKRFIAAHPGLYARLHLKNIATALFAAGSGDLMRLTNGLGMATAPAGLSNPGETGFQRVWNGGKLRVIVAGLLSGLMVVYLLAAVVGCFQRIPWQLRITLLAIGGYFWLVACLPQPPARLRHPLMPILCLLAAHGIVFLIPLARNAATRLRGLELLPWFRRNARWVRSTS